MVPPVESSWAGTTPKQDQQYHQKNIIILQPANNIARHLRSSLKKPDSTNDTASTVASICDSISSKVTFDKIMIRVHKLEIGDNPACSIGPPVQLSWEVEEEREHDINVYEQERFGIRRSNPRHLVLNYYQRVHMLKEAGYNESTIQEACREVARIQRGRSMTTLMLPVSKVEEVVRSAGRKLKRVGHRRAGQQQDR